MLTFSAWAIDVGSAGFSFTPFGVLPPRLLLAYTAPVQHGGLITSDLRTTVSRTTGFAVRRFAAESARFILIGDFFKVPFFALREEAIALTELVKVSYDNNKPTVLGRDLHEALGIQTPYHIWFPRMCEYGFVEGRDFCTKLYESTGGRPAQNHQLTIEMAKEICMIQRTEIGKRCREYFLEVERRYNEQMKALTPEELLFEQARLMLEHSRRLAAVEDKVNIIEAKLETRPEHCYTIAGYASLRGINVDVNRANMLGRKAAKLSREYGYEISKTQDQRYGSVNVYHEDILKIVFDKDGRYIGVQSNR